MIKLALLSLLIFTSVASAALIVNAVPAATNTLTIQTAPAETSLHLMFEGTPSSLSNSIQLSYSADYTLKNVVTPSGWTLLLNESTSPATGPTSFATYFFSGFSEGDPAEYHDFVQPVAFSIQLEAKTTEIPADPIFLGMEINHALFSPIFGLATTREFHTIEFATLPKPVAIPEPSSLLLLGSFSLASFLRRKRK